MTSTSTGFRIDIQALRAVAVLSVIAGHFWPAIFPGGFTGVDVFFVISGFLITSQIVSEVNRTGRLSVTDFWARRIRRIMPASLVVMTSVVLAVLWIGSSEQLVMLWRHVAASSLSAENLLLEWDSVTYDNREVAASPLQHFWSLAVEEQFYVVWPLVVGIVVATTALIRRAGVSIRFVLTATIVVISLVSFAYAIYRDTSDPASYFNPLSRAWELGVGAALAASGVTLSRWNRPAVRRALGAAAWIVVVGVSVVPNLSSFTPGVGVLASVLATGVIIALAQSPSRTLNPTLKSGVASLAWVGDRSYSIYLWHWPFLIVAPYVVGEEIGTLHKVLLLVLVGLASMVTYRFVELPFRNSTSPLIRKKRILFPLAATTTAGLILCTLLLVNSAESRNSAVKPDPLPSPIAIGDVNSINAEYPSVSPFCQGAGAAVFDCPTSIDVRFGELTLSKNPPHTSTCTPVEEGVYDDCRLGNVSSPASIALIGDSHAKALWAGFDYLGQHIDATVHLILRPGCAYGLSPKKACTERNAVVRERILAGEFDFVVFAQSVPSRERLGESVFLKKFGVPYRELREAQVPFVVVKDNPRLGDDELDCLRYKPRNADECSISRTKAFRHRDFAYDVATSLRIPTIDFSDIYCGPQNCPLAIGGVSVYRDLGHITTVFGQSLGPFLYNELTRLGLLPISTKP